MKPGLTDCLTDSRDAPQKGGAHEVARAAAPRPPPTPPVVGEVAATLAAHDLLPSLRRALALLASATGADNCEIFLREPEGGDLVLFACDGPDRDVLYDRSRFATGVGYPGIVVATRQPLVTADLGNDPRYLRRAVVARGLQACVCVPLTHGDKALGSLNVFARRADFPVDAVTAVLQQVAGPITHAIVAGLTVLRDSVDAVYRELDAGREQGPLTALRNLLHRIQTIAGAHHGSLSLLDPQSGRPMQPISTGTVHILCDGIKAGRWADCQFLPHGHGVALTAGRRSWPAACRGLPARLTTTCCIPLFADHRLHGLVGLDFGRQEADIAISSLVPLLAMAQQAAIRLQRHHTGLRHTGLRQTDAYADGDDLEVAATSSGAPAVVEDPQLEVRCFGPLEIMRRGELVPAAAFPRSKALLLLKVLITNAPNPLTKEALIETLWPDTAGRSATNRLHGVIHTLRAVIEPYHHERRWLYIRNHGELYYFDMRSPHRIDLFTFRHEIDAAKRLRDSGTAAERIARLEAAVGVYRGDLFADTPYEEWCDAERVALRERYLGALQTLARLHRQEGNCERAISCLRAALKQEPLREDLHQALIDLLLHAGRRKDALAQYAECERIIAAELDAEPLPQTQLLRAKLTRAMGG